MGFTWIYNQQYDVGCVWTCCTHQHGQSIQLTWWWTNPDKHGMEWDGMGFQMTSISHATSSMQISQLLQISSWAAMKIASQVACQCHATANLAGEACLFAGTALGIPWNSSMKSPVPWHAVLQGIWHRRKHQRGGERDISTVQISSYIPLNFE